MSEKCIHCRQTEGFHYQRADDPFHPDHLRCLINPRRPDLHPSNRFTPAVQANLATAETSIPPGCAPFDLPRALAGAELMTRDGNYRSNTFRERTRDHRREYEAMIGGQWYEFNADGTYWGQHKSDAWDLFLAAKEEPVIPSLGRVGDHSSVDDGEFEIPPSPTPETEARRSEAEVVLPTDPKELADFRAWCKLQEELAAQPKSETKRQIKVMEASEEDSAFPERRSWLAAPEDVWEPCPRGIGRWEFNWEDYDHRIRPAPAQPRRVWVNDQPDWCDAVSVGGAHLSESAARIASGNSRTPIEFIELNAAVRAKLGMGGGKV